MAAGQFVLIFGHVGMARHQRFSDRDAFIERRGRQVGPAHTQRTRRRRWSWLFARPFWYSAFRLPPSEGLVNRDGLGVFADGQVEPAGSRIDVAQIGVVARQPALIIGDVGVFVGKVPRRSSRPWYRRERQDLNGRRRPERLPGLLWLLASPVWYSSTAGCRLTTA